MEETTKHKGIEKMKGRQRMPGNKAHLFYLCSEHRDRTVTW